MVKDHHLSAGPAALPGTIPLGWQHIPYEQQSAPENLGYYGAEPDADWMHNGEYYYPELRGEGDVAGQEVHPTWHSVDPQGVQAQHAQSWDDRVWTDTTETSPESLAESGNGTSERARDAPGDTASLERVRDDDATGGPRVRRRKRKRSWAGRGLHGKKLSVIVVSSAVVGVACVAAVFMASGGKNDSRRPPEASAPGASGQPTGKPPSDKPSEAGDKGTGSGGVQAGSGQGDSGSKSQSGCVLPVKRHGLSARFGQGGTRWANRHTGIDFPVPQGTPIMAVTDGTVSTRFNRSYGNMAIVTASDGTQTWYCHLSATKVKSGSVKAGQEIAYSGSTGNVTGPHLHFEVRIKGQPVDPEAWLISHGLNPN